MLRRWPLVALDGQSGGLPGENSALEMHRIAARSLRQTFRDNAGTTVRPAIEHALRALRLGQGGRVESVERYTDRPFEMTLGELFGRAHVDQLDRLTRLQTCRERARLDRQDTGIGTCDLCFLGLADLTPGQDIEVAVTREDGSSFTFTALCRIDTANEMEYYRNGGILHYVLRKLAAA